MGAILILYSYIYIPYNTSTAFYALELLHPYFRNKILGFRVECSVFSGKRVNNCLGSPPPALFVWWVLLENWRFFGEASCTDRWRS